MNYLLTDEQKMIKDLAHKIAEERLRHNTIRPRNIPGK